MAPGTDNGMTQEHFDALGVWLADPISIFGTPDMVADLATAGFMLMGAASENVEAFTKLILRNQSTPAASPEQAPTDGAPDETATTPAPSWFLGCLQAQ
ncbi:MAG: hypothetical protein QOE41_218, partial [Mycobacterium sp.]|nr:hypothetical protein [Mycobacterium sp.]